MTLTSTLGQLRPQAVQLHASEKDANLAQKLGQLQPFLAVFPQACMGQLASSLGQPDTFLAAVHELRGQVRRHGHGSRPRSAWPSIGDIRLPAALAVPRVPTSLDQAQCLRCTRRQGTHQILHTHEFRHSKFYWRTCSEEDAELAQKLGQLQLSIAVLPHQHECVGQLASLGPTEHLSHPF